MREDLSNWSPRLESTIRDGGLGIIDRVAVLVETGSTQDTARAVAAGKPGLLLTADRQRSGRGRLGRSWEQGSGLAATLVVDPVRFDGAHLSLAAGVAVCWACAAAVESAVRCGRPDLASIHRPYGAPPARVGLRWPNDVVELAGRQRKIAGILIEVADGLACIGIGVNVSQKEEDWPRNLRGRACSLAMLGSGWSRVDVLESLLVALNWALLQETRQDLTRAWLGRDVLRGQVRTFDHGGMQRTGRVIRIDPTGDIVLKTGGGEVNLPAAATSLVHDTGE